MRVLSLDTATEACSAAVITEEGVFWRLKDVGRGHAEEILRMVDEVLGEAGATLTSLDGLAASVGPGSFTGVRISVSVAQGLAFGAGLPVVAVTTLEALAQQAVRGGAERVLACLDARMGEVYWGCFRTDPVRGVVACGPLAVGLASSVSMPASWGSVPFGAGETGASSSSDGPAFQALGRGLAAYPALQRLPGLLLQPGALAALPDARDLASLGVLRLRAGEGIDPADLAPQYLRDKVALTEAERHAAAGTSTAVTVAAAGAVAAAPVTRR